MTDHNHRDSSEQQDDHANQTTHHVTFDPKIDSVSGTLISTVATLNDVEPTELAILSNSVDPEALDALFESRHGETPRNTNRRVRFQYEDYTVRVQDGGAITLSHPTDFSTN
ncbi:hypothetical protein SAMN05421858_3112 [Haladaptatus litoreus]|uniref:Halobacterial output domain-containing protein n=1 Tax=Haladaptatus litoreus TaxID=553468 RepID=A0A1N7CN32_9EURY|nr:HalOD1 output domain-containing protein [Haladaptatus litoreus]SIR64887.1 hypothetical protein SAMN05421858_3112 [Haladaptatus litoreus]